MVMLKFMISPSLPIIKISQASVIMKSLLKAMALICSLVVFPSFAVPISEGDGLTGVERVCGAQPSWLAYFTERLRYDGCVSRYYSDLARSTRASRPTPIPTSEPTSAPAPTSEPTPTPKPTPRPEPANEWVRLFQTDSELYFIKRCEYLRENHKHGANLPCEEWRET